jgi:calcineurin-like phosphoesterase family protein
LLHLGDVGIGDPEGYVKLIRDWPGRKVLVRGNHDGKGCQWWMEHGFDFACDAMVYRGVWLTHKPWLGELPPGTHVNVHGHLHNVWDGFYPDDPEAGQDEFVVAAQTGRLLRPFHRLFAVEYTDYRPVEFDKFVAKPDKYQARGPSDETRKKMKLKAIVVKSAEHYKQLTGKEYSSKDTVKFVHYEENPSCQYCAVRGCEGDCRKYEPASCCGGRGCNMCEPRGAY